MSEREDIYTAVHELKNGKSILYPSDTVWGIGCDATNEDAVKKIQQIKGRDIEKSFIILVNSDAMLNKYVPSIPEVAWDLIDLSEKPLTIIYPSGGILLADSVIAKDGSVAVRVVKSGFCSELIKRLNRPLLSTSANLSGEVTPKNFQAISDKIKVAVDHIIPPSYAGHATGKASSIIKLQMNGRVEIIRK